jgi:hypothetical protein
MKTKKLKHHDTPRKFPLLKTKKPPLAAALAAMLLLYTGFPAATAQQLDNTQPDQNAAAAVQDIAAPISDTDGDPASAFKTDLAPYGTWMNLNGQMYWQPSQAGFGSNWRPYADGGHWVLTDAGWTWDSKYDWGWAPFHYGRWVDDPDLGWLWVPGWMWGPAWVAWRDNDTICGWAPLPPESEYDVGFGFRFHGALVTLDFNFGLGPEDYCFINISDICQPSYQSCMVPAQRAAEVYKQTTIVKAAFSVQSGQVINVGIAVDRVRAATHQEIKPLKIARAESSREKATTANTLKLYRPNLQLQQAIGGLLPPASRTHNPRPADAGGASDAMDELLLPAKTRPLVTQEPGGRVDKPVIAPESGHGTTDVVGTLLTRGHPPKSGPVGQPGSVSRGVAAQNGLPAGSAGFQTAPADDSTVSRRGGPPAPGDGSTVSRGRGPTTTPPAAQREAAQREAAQREAAQREAAQREAAQREAAQREAAQREAAQREAAQREAAQREAAQREAAQERQRQLQAEQERLRQEQLKKSTNR